MNDRQVNKNVREEELQTAFALIERCLQNKDDGRTTASTTTNVGPIDILDTNGKLIQRFNNADDCANAMKISVEMIVSCAKFHEKGYQFSFESENKTSKKSLTKKQTRPSTSEHTSMILKVEKRNVSSSSSSSSTAEASDDEEAADLEEESKTGGLRPVPVEQFNSTTNKTMEVFKSLSAAQKTTGVGTQTIRKAMESNPAGRTIKGKDFGFRYPTNTTHVVAEDDSDGKDSLDGGFVLTLPSSSSSTPPMMAAKNNDTVEKGHTKKRKIPTNVTGSIALDTETIRKMQKESQETSPRDKSTIVRKQPINSSVM